MFSCKKETQTVDPIVQPSPTPTGNHFGESIIRSSVGGVIVDENGNGVASATVQLGVHSVTTDLNGVFLFNDVLMNEKRTFVKVSKNGYFHGSRALYPKANSTSQIKVMLLASTSAGNFTASTGGVISSNGVSLNFPANSVKVEGGGAYSGTVNVALKFLDPTDDDMVNQMPGDLMAANSSNQLRVLETYGMAAVELTSPTGQKLNVADGKTVELTVPLSGAYLTDAPATIPLWYFDEVNGIWKEEGSATKVGSEYVGEVSHFSFWNCDNPQPSTSITGTIVCGGSPLANAYVVIKNTTSGRWLGGVTTDNLGQFSGFIPMNTSLAISVMSTSTCSTTPFYNAPIGPFSAPVVLPTITACPPTNTTGLFTATLLDCAGAPVTNGVLQVTMGGRNSYFFPDASGNISTNLIYCNNASFDVKAYDYANSKESATQTIITAATMAAGNITICGAIDEYVIYILDGTNYRIDKIPTNQLGQYSYTGATHIYAYENTTTNNLTTKILGNSVGTFAMEPDSNRFVNNLNTTIANTSVNATFTTYGTTSGTYKIGTFTGTFTDNSNVPHTLSGSFRLKNP